MSYIRFAVDAALAGLVIWYGYEFYAGYKAATGSWWQRAIAGGKGSATILWARFVQVVTAATVGVVEFSDFLNAPQVGSFIQANVKPQYVAGAFLLIAFITEIARKRKGSSNPV